jgi:D-glycero-beta-D-manno-heptose-7-phosphate kinase
VDSNDSFDKFPGAFSLTPNQPDLQTNLGVEIQDNTDLSQAAALLKQKLKVDELLVTRGAKGMALFSKDGEYFIPAFNLSEVFDVTGAGDTVAGTYSLGLAVGASSYESAVLGNLAASIAVKKYGTATVSDAELIELIDRI